MYYCLGWDHGPAGACCRSPTLGQHNAARPCPSASHLPCPLGVGMMPAICTAASGNAQPLRCVMARTPTVTRDQVPEPLRAAFDAETAGSGGTIVGGPGSVMIHSPEMPRRANAPGNYLPCEASFAE